MPARSPARPDFADVSDTRRRNMAAIGGRDTAPEMTLRRLLHALGYRYRLHVRNLPGRPDLVFAARRRVVEVRGCFWHRHGCRNSVLPATRRAWWAAKFRNTVARDHRNRAALESAGWEVCVVWECEIRADAAAAARKVGDFLGPPRACPAGTEPRPVARALGRIAKRA
jgi:DNA mismatch endonuclease Vsr